MPIEHVIYIHIPKAAGRTMHSIISRQYRRDEIIAIEGGVGKIELPPFVDGVGLRMVVGHVHYGLHERLPGISSYVTLLREPVSRVLSLYRYIATNPKHYLHKDVADHGLMEFVSSDADDEEIENGQTRQIAGVTHGSPDRSSLARAKRNLVEHFAAVGLVERFDESVILFRRRLGWQWPFYLRKNVTGTAPRNDTSDAALEIIRDRNILDIELYHFGRALFEQSVEREGPLFGVEVSIFQALNAVAQVYSIGTGRVRRMIGKWYE